MLMTMREVIENAGDEATGGESVYEVAAQWRDLGFSKEAVECWLAARCFNPNTAAELRDAGIKPVEACLRTDDRPEATLAYRFATGEIDLEYVQESVAKATARYRERRTGLGVDC